ncbi:helix-turn-helix domain-containing protein [Lysobacter sp. S4-A87]|uniref:helix-turn-helix domain-containing protein n=1 Tax=Lysobacter sp. S4-A87 TaxID=2925843 RepID=UPI001F534B61|nr:helix-turn-helix domain-containing protein [Lysobacter sp. S4-A87]UNK50967.1 helix-turn-helix domain-containing protein [Lysobacter sp. S4-A87]
MEQVQWADRGQLLQLDTADGAIQGGCIGVSRLGSVQVAGGFSIWVQLHGSSWVEAKEGKFRLRSGDWIAFEKDSKPTVQADRFGVCVGLTLSGDALREMTRFADRGLYAGRGNMPRRDARIALRLWREAAARLADNPAAVFDAASLRPILLHLAGVQRELAARIPRCPGRSRSRKRQVFGRLQRARLYLEGNCDRVVRISELAELTSFSSWYFSKTFHSLYEESPQAASARMRLEHAADLLTSTSMMIGEVAAASGFDNCCSFARAFRARFGQSASRYRSAAVSSRTDSAKSLSASRKAAERTGT